MVGADAGVELVIACSQIGVLVIAPGAGAQQAGGEVHRAGGKVGALALKAHHPGGSPRPPEHGLRPFDQGEHIERLWRDVGAGRVHAAWASTQHLHAIGQQRQARAKLATEHRVAIRAATAHGAKAGDGLEVIGGIAGRDGLAGDFRIGDHLHGRLVVNRGDDHLVQCCCWGAVLCVNQRGKQGGAGQRQRGVFGERTQFHKR